MTHYTEINGDDYIKCKVYPQQNSTMDLQDITEMMIVEYESVEYKIVYLKQKTQGNGFYLDMRAVPLFYDDFRTDRIYPLHNGSMTAVDCFTQLFNGTNYTFVMVDPAAAKTWQGFGGGRSRMELFKRALDHYQYEFYIQGRTVYLQSLIGNDTQYLYKYKLNASNIEKTIDAAGFSTYIKGYGGFEEGTEDFEAEAELKMDYTHPLAAIEGIGRRHAEPVTDGRITREDTMQEYMERALEETLMITVEANLHDVRQMGYADAVPQKGDRTFLMDERIGLDVEIRVHSVETTKDTKGKIVDCKATFGSQPIGKRYKANLTTLQKNMKDILDGKLELPYEILAPAAKEMLGKIKSVDTELLLDNGIFAIDPDNPNNIVGLNSAGIFISTDGGNTAETVLTAEGMVANSIKTGDLMTHLVRVVGTENLFTIDGDVATWIDASDTSRYIEIKPGLMTITKGAIEILNDSGQSKIDEWDSAEDNAVSRAENYSDRVGDNLKKDLRMTSPLPNSLALNSNGVTAYTSSTDRFARLDYRGLFIKSGAIQILGHDDREIMIDGLMRGSRVANIIHFNSNTTVNFDGMNWIYSSASPIRLYYIDDQYKGRFLDVVTATGLTYDSPSGSAIVDIRVTTLSGQIVASGSFFVAVSDEEMRYERIRCDLQALYGAVPDYRNVALYVQVQTTVNNSAKVAFRANKGEFND